MSDALPVEIEIDFSGANNALEAWQRQTAAAKEYTREIDKQHHAVQQLRDEHGRFSRAAASGAKDATSSYAQGTMTLRDFSNQIIATAATAASASAILSKLKAEWDDMKRRQDAAANTQIGVAKAQQGAFMNFGADATVQTRDQLAKEAAQIAARTRAGLADTYQVVSTVESNRGALSNRQALETAELSLTMNPDDVAAAQAQAAANLTLRRKSPQLGAKAALGLLMKGQGISPVKDAAAFGTNVAPQIANAVDFGESLETATALAGTLGQNMGDQTGAQTGTALMNLEAQLEKALPDVQGGAVGRLRYLQGPGRGLREKLAKNITGEAKAIPTFSWMIEGGDAFKLLEQNIGAIGKAADAGPEVDALMADLGKQAFQQARQNNLAFQQGAEGARLRDLKGGARAIAGRGLQDALSGTDAGVIERQIHEVEFGIATEFRGVDPGVAAQHQMQQRAASVRRFGTGFRGTLQRIGAAMTGSTGGFATEGDARIAADVERMAAGIDQLVKQQAEGNEHLERANRAPPVPVRPAAAAAGRKDR